MKRIVLAVIFGVASLTSIHTQAQVSVNINIGSQPQWGPAGYDHVDYYYLPDVDAYYNVPAKQYVYLNNGSWVWRNTLPSRYSGYDLYSAYKVVMNTPKPYLSHNSHVKTYSKYKNYKGKQANIRDSRDTRYANARTSRPASSRTTVVSHKTTVSRSTDRNNKDNRNNNGRNDRNQRGH